MKLLQYTTLSLTLLLLASCVDPRVERDDAYRNELIDEDILAFTQINEHFVEYLYDLDLAVAVENRHQFYYPLDIAQMRELYNASKDVYQRYLRRELSYVEFTKYLTRKEDTLINHLIFGIAKEYPLYEADHRALLDLRRPITISRESNKALEDFMARRIFSRNQLLFNRAFQTAISYIQHAHVFQDIRVPIVKKDEAQNIVVYACVATTNPTEEVSVYVDGKQLPFEEGKFLLSKSMIAEKDSILVRTQSISKITGVVTQAERFYLVEDIEQNF